MPAEVIVFDMDGVLVDVTGSYRETIRRTVRRFTGRDVGNDDIQELKNAGGWNNDWALSHKIISDFGVEVAYDDVIAYFQSIFLGENGLIRRERWLPRAGLLESLQQRYRLAIFTGRLRQEVDETLTRFAPRIRFDPIIGHEDVENCKPAPDGLARIAALTGGPLRYVGDSLDDARSARAAGVPFIGIASSENPLQAELAELLRLEGAAAVLEDVNQLEGVLAP